MISEILKNINIRCRKITRSAMFERKKNLTYFNIVITIINLLILKMSFYWNILH